MDASSLDGKDYFLYLISLKSVLFQFSGYWRKIISRLALLLKRINLSLFKNISWAMGWWVRTRSFWWFDFTGWAMMSNGMVSNKIYTTGTHQILHLCTDSIAATFSYFISLFYSYTDNTHTKWERGCFNLGIRPSYIKHARAIGGKSVREP